jgi:hypothetical protein
MAGRPGIASLDYDPTEPKEPLMYPSLMLSELALVRQRDLIADAAGRNLARQVRLARRAQHRHPMTPNVRRNSMRSATQPAHS